MAAIAWAGRRVIIAYDSDATENENVLWAEFNLAEALKDQGADVKAVRLRAGKDGAKQGLDDYLVANTADDLRKLIESAGDVESPETISDDRPKIVISTLEHEVNDQAAWLLNEDPELYQRGGLLVRCTKDSGDPTPFTHAATGPASSRYAQLFHSRCSRQTERF